MAGEGGKGKKKGGGEWTPERVEQLRRLASEGVPIDQACGEMGCDAEELIEKAEAEGIEFKRGSAE